MSSPYFPGSKGFTGGSYLLPRFSSTLEGFIDMFKEADPHNNDALVRVAHRVHNEFETKFHKITWFS